MPLNNTKYEYLGGSKEPLDELQFLAEIKKHFDKKDDEIKKLEQKLAFEKNKVKQLEQQNELLQINNERYEDIINQKI